jgi:hypothetical protein
MALSASRLESEFLHHPLLRCAYVLLADPIVSQCHCGNAINAADPPLDDMGYCNLPCAEDDDFACGGQGVFLLYSKVQDGVYPLVEQRLAVAGTQQYMCTQLRSKNPPVWVPPPPPE